MGAGGGGAGEEQGRKVNVLKGVIIGVLGTRAGLGWILKPFPPPHAPLHRRGKLIFFLKEQKERSGMKRRERERVDYHTRQVNKSQPKKKISFFSVSPPVHPLLAF